MSVEQLSNIDRIKDGFFTGTNAVFNTVALVFLLLLVIVLFFTIVRAVIVRRRNRVQVIVIREPVTVVSVGPEFARPLAKKRDRIVVAVLRTVTCRSDAGQTVQVDLPYAEWGRMPPGAQGLLVVHGRKFVSFK